MRIFLALPLLAVGCGLVGFDVEERIPEQVIAGSALSGVLPLSLFQIPMQIDIEEKTRAQGTGPASAAFLKAISLQVLAPAGQTFDFVDSIVVTIVADGLPEREVARYTGPRSVSRIDFQILRGIDVLPYVKRGSTMAARGTGRSPRQDTRFDGRVVVTIEI